MLQSAPLFPSHGTAVAAPGAQTSISQTSKPLAKERSNPSCLPFFNKHPTDAKEILPVSKMGCFCLNISFTKVMTSDTSVFLLSAWQHKCGFPMPASLAACPLPTLGHAGPVRAQGLGIGDVKLPHRPPKDSLTQTSEHESQDVFFLTVSLTKLIKEMKIPSAIHHRW